MLRYSRYKIRGATGAERSAGSATPPPRGAAEWGGWLHMGLQERRPELKIRHVPGRLRLKQRTIAATASEGRSQKVRQSLQDNHVSARQDFNNMVGLSPRQSVQLFTRAWLICLQSPPTSHRETENHTSYNKK